MIYMYQGLAIGMGLICTFILYFFRKPLNLNTIGVFLITGSAMILSLVFPSLYQIMNLIWLMILFALIIFCISWLAVGMGSAANLENTLIQEPLEQESSMQNLNPQEVHPEPTFAMEEQASESIKGSEHQEELVEGLKLIDDAQGLKVNLAAESVRTEAALIDEVQDLKVLEQENEMAAAIDVMEASEMIEANHVIEQPEEVQLVDNQILEQNREEDVVEELSNEKLTTEDLESEEKNSEENLNSFDVEEDGTSREESHINAETSIESDTTQEWKDIGKTEIEQAAAVDTMNYIIVDEDEVLELHPTELSPKDIEQSNKDEIDSSLFKERLPENEPGWQALNDGLAAHLAGNLPLAVDLYTQAITKGLNQDHLILASIDLYRIYYKMGKYTKAKQLIELTLYQQTDKIPEEIRLELIRKKVFLEYIEQSLQRYGLSQQPYNLLPRVVRREVEDKFQHWIQTHK